MTETLYVFGIISNYDVVMVRNHGNHKLLSIMFLIYCILRVCFIL